MTNKECKFSYRESIFKKKDDLMITSIKLKLSKEPKVNTSYKSLKNFLIKDDINPNRATPYQVCRAVTSIRNQILPDFKVEPNVGSFFKNLILDETTFNKLKKKNVDLPHFKNPKDLTYKVPVAFLIENAGWKGKKQGNVRVSEKHALVLIADKGSNSEQLIKLSSVIAKDIYEKTQVELEVEPKIF
jgi:UDP-N-acetylmuramate dehydrogenase